jgi:hypothetical protein
MAQTTLGDISTVIGYDATRSLHAWFAGRSLYVPLQPEADHPLAILLGLATFRFLVGAYAGEMLKIPTEAAENWAFRDRRIAEMLAAGQTAADVATQVDLSERRVQQIRDELVLRGWLQYAEGARAAGSGRWRATVPEVLGATLNV